jgi:hypothetical protein
MEIDIAILVAGWINILSFYLVSLTVVTSKHRQNGTHTGKDCVCCIFSAVDFANESMPNTIPSSFDRMAFPLKVGEEMDVFEKLRPS